MVYLVKTLLTAHEQHTGICVGVLMISLALMCILLRIW